MDRKSQLCLNLWWLLFIGFCILAFCIQQKIRIMHDVAIAATISSQMLDGQTYAKDIFDPNPPMIFYLLMPAILMAKYLGIKALVALHVYLITLISISTITSFFLLKKILYPSVWLTGLMTISLAIILLFLPVEVFGQREHIYLMLIIPYIFLAVARLENVPISTGLSIFIGIMAGLGFSIKPFFLPTLGLIECLFMYRSRRWFGWVRIESLIVCAIIVFYFLSVLIAYPTYWQTVLPMWMPFYRAIVQPWYSILLNLYFIFCCVVMVFAYYSLKNGQQATLKTVLLLSILGNLISYLVPRVAWYYHILPAFSFAFLCCILLIGELLESLRTFFKGKLEWCCIGFLVVAILLLPLTRIVSGTKVAIRDFYEDASLNQLITYVNEHKNIHSFVSFSVIHHLYVLEYYTNIKQVGSFSFFVWEWEPHLLPSVASNALREKIMPYAMEVIKYDLNDKKPQWIIVDSSSTLKYLNEHIDYVKAYSSYDVFKDAFSQYSLIKTIGPYLIYARNSL